MLTFCGGGKLKHCLFCNAELPDEASFCLSCASVLNCREEAEEKSKTVFFTKNRKIIALCISAVLIFVATFISACRMHKLPLSSQISFEPKTTLVPVTEENGETVTDVQGNTVYEAVTLEPTTEKSIFSNIIGSIFGNDEPVSEQEEPQPSSSAPTDSSSDATDVPPSATQPTEAPPPTEAPTTVDENPAEVFEYASYEKSATKISITKYKGNASYVTVPDYINGLMVVEIRKGAFLNNSKIKTIDIVKGNRSFIWLCDGCFNNLSSLTTVNLYDNNLGLMADFAIDCPIKDFNITYWQYKFVNGAIYAHNSREWEFKTFCGNPCYTTLTIEPWCRKISNDNNLDIAKNLKVINAHKDVTNIPTFTLDYHKNLEAINVESGNERYLSKDGVLFAQHYTSGGYVNAYDAYYPASKKDKTFTMPQKEGFAFYLDATTSHNKNPYLEEIYLPLNASITISAYSSAFPNLKKLYFAKGNPCYDNVRFEFTGETKTY